MWSHRIYLLIPTILYYSPCRCPSSKNSPRAKPRIKTHRIGLTATLPLSRLRFRVVQTHRILNLNQKMSRSVKNQRSMFSAHHKALLLKKTPIINQIRARSCPSIAKQSFRSRGHCLNPRKLTEISRRTLKYKDRHPPLFHKKARIPHRPSYKSLSSPSLHFQINLLCLRFKDLAKSPLTHLLQSPLRNQKSSHKMHPSHCTNFRPIPL